MDKKVGVIGVGNVGSSLAYILATKSICSHIVLDDLREDYLEAMALDISQSSNASGSHTLVKARKNKNDLNNCDVIVITAGIPRKPGMSRDDLLLTNAGIMRDIICDIKEVSPNAIIIVVSNPLDAMVYAALKFSGFDKNKVIGMAGILDSSRMAHFIQEKLGYGAGQINASVMGGHGDEMVPLTNHSNVAGVCIEKLLSKSELDEIVEKTKNGGAQIVKLLKTGSAYYAPAYSTAIMLEAILNNTKKIYPCSVFLDGEYSHSNVVAGVPVRLGNKGLENIVQIELKEEQKKTFHKSVNSVNELIKIIDKNLFNL